MKRSMVFLCSLFLLLGLTGALSAETIDWTDITPGNSVTIPGFVTITSSPANFAIRTWQGVTGFGVAGGAVDGEIDLLGDGVDTFEYIFMEFAQPTIIEQITLSALYANGNYGDLVNETASISYNNAFTWPRADLTVVDANNASWSGNGTVTNLSPGVEGGAGVWQITNPFLVPITSLKFWAIGNYIGTVPDNNTNSDFSIVSVTGRTESVPEPTTMLLLGLGLVGLASARKKFKK